MKINKKLLSILVLGVLVIGSVVAGVYYVNSLTLEIDAKESFTVKYAVLGDGGTYEESDGVCEDLSIDDERWFTSESESLPTGGFYPGESRMVCVMINNAGEVAVPYQVVQNVLNEDWTTSQKCKNAFGVVSPGEMTGTVPGLGYAIDGKLVVYSYDAEPVDDCLIEIKAGRGIED